MTRMYDALQQVARPSTSPNVMLKRLNHTGPAYDAGVRADWQLDIEPLAADAGRGR